MKNNSYLLEPTIISLLFLSLFTSKSMIYISLILLLILQISLIIKDPKLVKECLNNKLAKLSVLLFATGTLSTLSFTDSFNDFLIYFRKSAIFLLLPLLYIQLNRNNNAKYASYALWTSLIIALGYAGSKIWGLGIENWHGQRIDSFWDLGRWSEVLGYSIAVLVPLTLEQTSNKRRKIVLTGTLILALTFLIFSGGRGPFLALLVSCSLYLLYRKPSLLVAVAILCSLFLYTTKELPQVHAVTERIVSIADLHNNDSNNARMAIWSQGAAFSSSLLQESPHTFLMGTGIEQFEGLFTEFLQKSTNIEQLLASTNNQFSFKDLHNTYLDLAVKLGAIYSLFFIVFLVAIFISFCKRSGPLSPWGYSGACLMLTYFVNSMFYTSGLEYQTTIFFLIIALCHTQLNQDIAKSTANV